MNQRDIGWVAGIVEGEGCLYHKPEASARVTVTNCDHWMLRKLQRLLGGTISDGPRQRYNPNAQDQWLWSTNSIEAAQAVVSEIFDELSPRRKKAAQAILEQERKGYWGPPKVYGETCQRGHVLAEATTHKRGNNGRLHCAICGAIVRELRNHKARTGRNPSKKTVAEIEAKYAGGYLYCKRGHPQTQANSVASRTITGNRWRTCLLCEKQNLSARPGHPVGGRNSKTKLNPGRVREIRARVEAGEMQTVLAAEFGVAQPTINALVHRRTWRHV